MKKMYKHILVEEDMFWKLRQVRDTFRLRTWTDLFDMFLKEIEVEVPEGSGQWKTLNELVS